MMDEKLSEFDTFGEVFGSTDDLLAQFDSKFKQLEASPAEIYKHSVISEQNISKDRRRVKKRTVDRWMEHMKQYDRHHACPSVRHAAAYIDKELQKDITPDWVYEQTGILSSMFEYWSTDPNMPHGRGELKNYNPIDKAVELRRSEISKRTSDGNQKPPHRMTTEEIAHHLRQMKNVLHRCVVTAQFKFGVRSGQVCELLLPEVQIQNEDLNELYPSLGTHKALERFDEDVIYFVPRSERYGGKSAAPTIMPIDEEMKQLFIKYLRQRPPISEDWFFVNNSTVGQLNTDYLNKSVWKPAFHPEYAETELFKGVTSHFGRHVFNTYWRKEIDINREYLKYMRGDKTNKYDPEDMDVIEDYVHTYYLDIRDDYLAKIYKFDL